MYAEAILKKGEGRTLKSGGAWIYDNEIDLASTGPWENGGAGARRGLRRLLCWAGASSTPALPSPCGRCAAGPTHVIDRGLPGPAGARRPGSTGRTTVDTGCCRLIFGEADWLPGLVVDKFSDVLVVESLALGIDRLKPTILSLVKKVLAEDGIMIRGIYERSDAKVRLQEGMERFKGFIGDPFAHKG